jgi:hypothetical protein
MITPDHSSTGKRFEYVRDLQKIAVLMYRSIADIPDINIASPGGGQYSNGYADGMAVKPQIGESPSQVIITGFVNGQSANVQHFDTVKRISGNEVYDGHVSNHAQNDPSPYLDSLVDSIKLIVESSLNADLPSSISFEVFRIELSGVIYGDRGRHFP